MKFRNYFLVFICLKLGSAFDLGVCAEAVLLNTDIIGKSLDTNQTVLLKASNTNQGVAPLSVDLELSGSIVVGATLVYPRKVSMEDIRNSINRSFGGSEKKLNYQGVYAWRLESKQVAMQVGAGEGETVTLVVRSTNKVFSNSNKKSP